jgi:hypothetical protein
MQSNPTCNTLYLYAGYTTPLDQKVIEMPVPIDSWRKALLLICDLVPMPSPFLVLPAGIRCEDVSTIVAIVDIDEDVSRRHYYRMQ